ncbi:MAG: type III-A CRISPR-associated RAMP protein Csm4 [Chloroflexi bacterium]|nr:type III-A CRISPR-associated RAMP protein Csm4 [Chloroflexota bacterium]
MPDIIPYHLTFPHGLHVGRGVENLAESRVGVPSDTLYAALMETWRITGRDVKALLASEDAKLTFHLTSAFPYAGGIRFYPLPVDLRVVLTQDRLMSLGASKTVKKIRYFSEGLLNLAREGNRLDDWLPDEKQTKGMAMQGGTLWLAKDEANFLPPAIRNKRDKNGKLTEQPLPLESLPYQRVWQSHTAPRVAVDRINSSPNLFQSERVLFTKGCGLWFGMWGEFAELKEMLTVLGENGLGGERTAGYGKFTFEEKPLINFPDPDENLTAYLLSRYHPRDDKELSLLRKDQSFYRLEAVNGYLHTLDGAAQRRKRLWLVCEGSLIEGNPNGNAPDTRPEYEDKNNPGHFLPGMDHPVYRPGFALAIGWKL